MKGLLATSLALAVATTGCTLTPIYARRMEGRVVDGITGRPIAGAAVTSYYEFPLLFTHGGSVKRGRCETFTDADGRFVLEGRFVFEPDLIFAVAPNPTVTVRHPEQGSEWLPGYRGPIGPRIELPLVPSDEDLERLRKGNSLGEPALEYWICLGEPECFGMNRIELEAKPASRSAVP